MSHSIQLSFIPVLGDFLLEELLELLEELLELLEELLELLEELLELLESSSSSSDALASFFWPTRQKGDRSLTVMDVPSTISCASPA